MDENGWLAQDDEGQTPFNWGLHYNPVQLFHDRVFYPYDRAALEKLKQFEQEFIKATKSYFLIDELINYGHQRIEELRRKITHHIVLSAKPSLPKFDLK